MSAIDIGIVRYLFPQPLCGSLSIPFRGLVNHLQYVEFERVGGGGAGSGSTHHRLTYRK